MQVSLQEEMFSLETLSPELLALLSNVSPTAVIVFRHLLGLAQVGKQGFSGEQCAPIFFPRGLRAYCTSVRASYDAWARCLDLFVLLGVLQPERGPLGAKAYMLVLDEWVASPEMVGALEQAIHGVMDTGTSHRQKWIHLLQKTRRVLLGMLPSTIPSPNHPDPLRIVSDELSDLVHQASASPEQIHSLIGWLESGVALLRSLLPTKGKRSSLLAQDFSFPTTVAQEMATAQSPTSVCSGRNVGGDGESRPESPRDGRHKILPNGFSFHNEERVAHIPAIPGDREGRQEKRPTVESPRVAQSRPHSGDSAATYTNIFEQKKEGRKREEKNYVAADLRLVHDMARSFGDVGTWLPRYVRCLRHPLLLRVACVYTLQRKDPGMHKGKYLCKVLGNWTCNGEASIEEALQHPRIPQQLLGLVTACPQASFTQLCALAAGKTIPEDISDPLDVDEVLDEAAARALAREMRGSPSLFQDVYIRPHNVLANVYAVEVLRAGSATTYWTRADWETEQAIWSTTLQQDEDRQEPKLGKDDERKTVFFSHETSRPLQSGAVLQGGWTHRYRAEQARKRIQEALSRDSWRRSYRTQLEFERDHFVILLLDGYKLVTQFATLEEWNAYNVLSLEK